MNVSANKVEVFFGKDEIVLVVKSLSGGTKTNEKDETVSKKVNSNWIGRIQSPK
jgi:hypothetical protein